jgi:streptogramin lyase
LARNKVLFCGRSVDTITVPNEGGDMNDWTDHWSDCAVYNATAYEPGPCNCRGLAFHRNALAEFAALADDWGGYGAVRIHPETLAVASEALPSLVYAVDPYYAALEIMPSPDGAVSFQWDGPAGFAHLKIGARNWSFYARLSSSDLPFAVETGAWPSNWLAPWSVGRLRCFNYQGLR